jgi:prolyl oligopeptidase PreP (S9A serine peptidase family)
MKLESSALQVIHNTLKLYGLETAIQDGYTLRLLCSVSEVVERLATIGFTTSRSSKIGAHPQYLNHRLFKPHSQYDLHISSHINNIVLIDRYTLIHERLAIMINNMTDNVHMDRDRNGQCQYVFEADYSDVKAALLANGFFLDNTLSNGLEVYGIKGKGTVFSGLLHETKDGTKFQL